MRRARGHTVWPHIAAVYGGGYVYTASGPRGPPLPVLLLYHAHRAGTHTSSFLSKPVLSISQSTAALS